MHFASSRTSCCTTDAIYPSDLRKHRRSCSRHRCRDFVIAAAAAASISTMHLLALVAAAALRHTNALSAPNLRPRTVSTTPGR